MSNKKTKTSSKKENTRKKKTIKKNQKSKTPKNKRTNSIKRPSSSCMPLFKWILIIVVWGTLLGGLGIIWFGYDIPSSNKLSEITRRPSVTLLAKDGSRIATIGDYYGKPIDAKKLPKRILNAFTATEDRRFFDHFGIDVFAIGRAFIRNLKAGRVVQGGSTITQQLAKNFLLAEGLYTYQDRSLRRKIQEVLLSFWLEYKFTKHQIMTIYLNRVYFGSGAFGLGAAAKHYFDKETNQLTSYEAALLAGLLKAPSKYSPLNNLKLSEMRTQCVLSAMLDAGYISDAERNKLRSPPPIKLASNHCNFFARYFVDWVLETLPEMLGNIMQDLVITTTLDIKLQKKAEKLIRDVIHKDGEALNASQGAMVSMSPSGSIRAMVGGCSYGESQFNRAVQAYRQTGSAFKLFVYLAALESGITPERRIIDSPIKIGSWKPKNYGWKTKGNVSMTEGLAYSINSVSVRLTRYAGISNVAEMATRLGISRMQPRNFTIALGTGDASLLEMVEAYGTVLREGYPAEAFGIIEIRTKRGKSLFRHPPQSFDRLLSPSVAKKMNQMLQAVMNYGTGRNVKIKGVKCAGKSGTSQDYKDAWFIGYTDHLITGVWVGNDNNNPMKKVTGAKLPGQIWHKFME